MLWPPTPCVSPQLHQAISRPGFHGAWWCRSRTTRVLRDPPPAHGKRQGGDDGRTKTTPQHRARAQRARPWALTESPRTARTPRTPRVARPYARAMPRSSPRLRRRREAELPRFAARIEERGEKGDTTRGEKRGDSSASPDPARLRRREPPDHTTITRPRPRLAGVAYRDARSRGLAPRAAVSKEKTRRHDKAADRRQVRPTITTDRRVTKTRTVM